MNSANWQTVKNAWGAFYDQIQIIADGHKLTLQTQRNGMSLLMVIYVDGFIKGEYMSAESEIGQKFYNERKIPVYKAKDLKENAKVFGKRSRMAKQKYVSSLSPYWKSFAAFKKQLTAKCKSLELVTVAENHPINSLDYLSSRGKVENL
ncbi:hypothetical protein J3L18_10770 [Mucilaginibacter gossypii]|uniref:hypothetical protein n=1 Tax=Mucilaginibacter gossypii TaxID=551996 RepID=UPI000DCB0EE7|nr:MULTISPECIES: hypothetical protein [Mucilaginibacter]QTE39509.1 hypothetical protein J3L18_10770 [Mucilaginibacter gossypii]RAV56130.1 hypothetical protein DIU36_15355 [Mucilaginibacter rubeus]